MRVARSGSPGSSASRGRRSSSSPAGSLRATEAGRIGLVSEVVPAGQAVARAREIGEEIAARGPIAVREAKRLIDASLDTPIEDGLAAELEASLRVFATDDLAEGAAAFFAKRDPQYRGR